MAVKLFYYILGGDILDELKVEPSQDFFDVRRNIYDRDVYFRSSKVARGELMLYAPSGLELEPQNGRAERVKKSIDDLRPHKLTAKVQDALKNLWDESLIHLVVEMRPATSKLLDYTLPYTLLPNPPASNKHRDAVTFKIRRKWHVEYLNGYSRAVTLPPFIKSVVEKSSQAADNDRAIAESLFQCFKNAITHSSNGPAQIPYDFSSNPTDASLHDLRYHEMLHYVHALNCMGSQLCDLIPLAVREFSLTMDRARYIVFESFKEYWLKQVEGARCTFGEQLPFPLVAEKYHQNVNKRRTYKYRPRPDVAFLKHGFPRFLVQFDSDVNWDDKYWLYVQMACALHLARAFREEAGMKDQEFFLMGAFFTQSWEIKRCFFYIDENGKTCFHEEEFRMSSPRGLITFLSEFYNYARHVNDEDTLGYKKLEIWALTELINRDYTESLTSITQSTKSTHSETSQDDSNQGLYGELFSALTERINRDYPESLITQSSKSTHSETSQDDSNQGERKPYGEIIDALQELHFQIYEYPEDFEPLDNLPAHIVEATSPDGNEIVAKLQRKNSEELSLLRELSLQKSPHNHVIPLLGTIPSSLGPLIILPQSRLLSYVTVSLYFGGDCGYNPAQLSHELVEGVAFLHRQKIAHLDIKPDNLVYSFRFGRLYIIDFDTAMQCKDVMVKVSRGTRGWSAPEIDLDDNKPLRAFNPIRADLWSCGKVLRYFAEVTGKAIGDITVLMNLLMDDEPRRRPLLHEVVDEGRDFWTSGRLRQALMTQVGGDRVRDMTLRMGARSKRACDDDG